MDEEACAKCSGNTGHGTTAENVRSASWWRFNKTSDMSYRSMAGVAYLQALEILLLALVDDPEPKVDLIGLV